MNIAKFGITQVGTGRDLSARNLQSRNFASRAGADRSQPVLTQSQLYFPPKLFFPFFVLNIANVYCNFAP